MEHLLLKATVTAATEEGTFTAVISTAAIDRDKDIVEPSAVVDALQKWVPTGKKVPLSWNHSVAAEDIIGHLNPESAHVAGREVVADGWVDQSIEHGKHAWRLVKSGTLGFSYGYLVVKADKRKDGGLHIKALDIFEVTATPIPANAETRVLAWKSAAAEVFPEWALEAALDGHLKAVWTTAYINDLPDSAFLYVEPGDKDSEGKTTPRSKRHFPVKDANGNIDMPHLRNALARIPQSSLSQEIKDRCTAKAQRMMDSTKSADRSDERSEDPLKQKARTAMMSVLGEGSTPPATVTQEPPPRPDLDPDELKRRSRDLIVQLLNE